MGEGHSHGLASIVVSELGALNAKIVWEVWSAKVFFSTVAFWRNSLVGGAVRKRTSTEAALAAPASVSSEVLFGVSDSFSLSVLATPPVAVFDVVL